MLEPKLRFPDFKDTWKHVCLSEILIERNEKTKINENTPLLSFTIERGVINPEDKETNKRDFLIKDKDNKVFLTTEYNDIIYNPANIKFGAIHRNKLGRGCVSPIYAIFHTTEDPNFIELIVKNESFIKKSLKYLEGTVVKLMTLKPNDFLKMDAYIPSKDEQVKISDFFNNIDIIIKKSEEEISNLEKKRKYLLKKLLSKELRFKKDDGSEYPEWEDKRLSDVCECLDRLRKPVSKFDRVKGIYPYYGATNIQDYVSEYIFDEPLVLLAEDGGPFMEFMDKPIAQWTEGKCWVNNHAHVLRPLENKKFLFYSLVHKDIRKYINNPGRAKLNQEDMMSLKINMPSLEEQKMISDFMTQVDNAITLSKNELELWKIFKKGLLQKMII